MLEKSDYEKNAKEQFIQVLENCELRTLTFDKVKNPSEDIEIMFMPGFLSTFNRWEDVVKRINEFYKIHYIETRDKLSSRLTRKASMKICDLCKDIDFIEKTLGLNKRKYITISSSMSGSVILENLASEIISPIGSILIGPMIEIYTPKWIPALLKILPPFAVNWLKPLIIWGMRTKMVDAEKEPEQLDDYVNAINVADCSKMRKWILDNANKYKGWNILPKINNRIILIGTTTDRTHDCEMVRNIAGNLSNCTYIELRLNKPAQDLAFVDIAFKFIKELSGNGPILTEENIAYKI